MTKRNKAVSFNTTEETFALLQAYQEQVNEPRSLVMHKILENFFIREDAAEAIDNIKIHEDDPTIRTDIRELILKPKKKRFWKRNK